MKKPTNPPSYCESMIAGWREGVSCSPIKRNTTFSMSDLSLMCIYDESNRLAYSMALTGFKAFEGET